MQEIYRSPPFNLEGYVAYTVKYEDGSKATVLQHREVFETKIGRRLGPNEIIHHKDEIKTRTSHGKLHAVYRRLTLVCVLCGTKFERPGNDERHNRKTKAGPFCGRRCAGRWSRQQQIAKGVINTRSAGASGLKTVGVRVPSQVLGE